MRKTILALVALSFLMTSVCFAAKLDPTQINIPRDSGRIVETYVSPKADAPLIVYLQDIHVNYEAQKAEADILEALIRDYGFDLILVEAKQAGFEKDFKYLRKDAPIEARAMAAENLLKKGTISSPDYVDLATDYDFVVEGAEDLSIYMKEAKDLAEIFGKREDMSSLAATLKNITSNLKLHIYTKEMRDLDDKIAAYDKDEIGLVEYVKFLEGQAAANNIDVKAFLNLALFIESANLEGQIDFPAVETERTTVVDAVQNALKDKAKDDFLAKGLQFRTGDMSQGEYYTYLSDTAKAAKVDISTNKNLTAYTTYITTYEKIDTILLFKEIDNLADKIKVAMTTTPEQKKLNQIDKGLSILSDMTNTKLVPDEYDFYMKNKAEFDLDGWLVFLKDNSAKFGLTNPVPDDIALLKANMSLLERFYALSYERDNAFIKNIKASLAKRNKDKAIFQSGGFHTPNMKKLLKENGFSYVVVAPRVDVIKDYGDIYRAGMKQDLEFLQKSLRGSTIQATANNIARLSAIHNAETDEQVQAAVQEAVALFRSEQYAGMTTTAPDAVAALQPGTTLAQIADMLVTMQGQAARDFAERIAHAMGLPLGSQLYDEASKTLYGIRSLAARHCIGVDAAGNRVYVGQGITIDSNPVTMVKAFRDEAVALAENVGLTDTSDAALEEAVKNNTNDFRTELQKLIGAHELGHTAIDQIYPLRGQFSTEREEQMVQALAKRLRGLTLSAEEQAAIQELKTTAQKVAAENAGVARYGYFATVISEAVDGNLTHGAIADDLVSKGIIASALPNFMDLSSVKVASELEKRRAQGEEYGIGIPTAAADQFIGAVDANNTASVGASLANAEGINQIASRINLLTYAQRQAVLGMIENIPTCKTAATMLREENKAVEQALDMAGIKDAAVRADKAEDIIRQMQMANAGARKVAGQQIKGQKAQGVLFLVDEELITADASVQALTAAAKATLGAAYDLKGTVRKVKIDPKDPQAFNKQKQWALDNGYVPIVVAKNVKALTPEQLSNTTALPSVNSLATRNGVNVARAVFRIGLAMEGLRGVDEAQRDNGASRIAAELTALSFHKGAAYTMADVKNILPGVKNDTERFDILSQLATLLPAAEAMEIQEFMQELMFASFA